MVFVSLKDLDADALLALRADVEGVLAGRAHDLQRQIALLPRKATDVGVDPLTVALHDALCRRTQHEPAAFVNGGCHLLSHHKVCFSVRQRAADSELHCAKPNYLLGLYGEHRQVGP